MSETVKRITELQLCGSDSRAQSYNEGLKAAIHILESCEQPQLNENQQIVLEWLKLQAPTAKPMQVIFWMMNNAAWGKLDELRKPIMHLTDKQQAQVLEEFGKWAQEQEEKQ